MQPVKREYEEIMPESFQVWILAITCAATLAWSIESGANIYKNIIDVAGVGASVTFMFLIIHLVAAVYEKIYKEDS